MGSPAGAITFDGRDVSGLRARELRRYYAHVQGVFQDPFSSLNPRHTIESILTAPLYVHGIGDRAERRRRVAAIVEPVLAPFRRLIPMIGGLDLSPLFALIAIQAVSMLLPIDRILGVMLCSPLSRSVF